MKKIKKYVIKINENEFMGKLAYSQHEPALIEKKGFNTHQETINWLEQEIEEGQLTYDTMSFYKLSQLFEQSPYDKNIQYALQDKIRMLKDQMIFTLVVKENNSEHEARRQVNLLCGKKWTDSLEKAKNKTLDALENLEQEKTENRLNNLLSYYQNSQWEGSEEANIVLQLLCSIPGDKILTVVIGQEEQQFDINDEGFIGHASEHQNILLKKIDQAFKMPNCFFVRQFIPNSEEKIIINDKNTMISWKAIYGFCLDSDRIIAIPAEDVEYAFSHDQNDKPIDIESHILFKDFSDFLS